jgi:hypothetical protein
MNTYAIRRQRAWESPEELEETAGRSKEIADTVIIRPDPQPQTA